jgi:ATP-dependent Lon protease
MDRDKRIVLVTQRSAEVDDPARRPVRGRARWPRCCNCCKLPDGTTKVLVEGGERVRIKRYQTDSGFFEASWELIPMEEEASEK